MLDSLLTKLHLLTWLLYLVSFAINILGSHNDGSELNLDTRFNTSLVYNFSNQSMREVPNLPRFRCDFTGQCITVWVFEPPCFDGYLEPRSLRPGYMKVSLRGSNLCSNNSLTFSLGWLWASTKTEDGREIRRCRELWTCVVPLKTISPSDSSSGWLDVVVSTNQNLSENSIQADLPVTISLRSKQSVRNDEAMRRLENNSSIEETKPVGPIKRDILYHKEGVDEMHSQNVIGTATAPTQPGNNTDTALKKPLEKVVIRSLILKLFNKHYDFTNLFKKHNKSLAEAESVKDSSQLKNYRRLSGQIAKTSHISNHQYHNAKVTGSKTKGHFSTTLALEVILSWPRKLKNPRTIRNRQRFSRSIRHVDDDEAADIALLMSGESKEDQKKIASMIASDFESTAGLSNPVITRNHWRGGSASSISRAKDHGLRDMNRLINVIEDEEDKVASNLPIGDGDQEELLVEIGSEAHLAKLRHQIKTKKRKLEHAKVALNKANLLSLAANTEDLGGVVPGEVIVEKNELKATVSDLESSLQRLRDQYSDLVKEKEDSPAEARKFNGVVKIDPVWSLWSAWSTCSGDCSKGGYSVRRRSCDTMPSVPCPGSNFDMKMCNEIACEGHWIAWGSWGPCSVSCGRGVRARSRVCVGGSPDSTANCHGPSAHSAICNLVPCSTYSDAESNLIPPETTHKKVEAAKAASPHHSNHKPKHEPKAKTTPKPKPKPQPKPQPTRAPIIIKKMVKPRHRSRGRGRGRREALQSHGMTRTGGLLIRPRYGSSGLNRKNLSVSLLSEGGLAMKAKFKSKGLGRDKRGVLQTHGTSHAGPLVVPKKYRDHSPPLFHPFLWGVWGEWSSCSQACGEGTMHRTRICIDYRNMHAKEAHAARCKPGPAEVGLKCVGDRCGRSPEDPRAEAAAAAAGMAAASVDEEDSDDILSDDEPVVSSVEEPAMMAAAGAAAVAEGGVHEAAAHEAAAQEEQAEEEEETELTAETIIFVVLLILLLALIIVAFCIWFSSRYQEAKMKRELSEALPFYNTNEDLDDLGDEGDMFDSKSRGVVKPVIRNQADRGPEVRHRKTKQQAEKMRLKRRAQRFQDKAKIGGFKIKCGR